jgi:hypothetical protein
MWHENREAVMFMIGFGVVAVLALLGLLINALGAEPERCPNQRNVFAWLPKRMHRHCGPGSLVEPAGWAWLRIVSRQRTVVGELFYFEPRDEHEDSGHSA